MKCWRIPNERGRTKVIKSRSVFFFLAQILTLHEIPYWMCQSFHWLLNYSEYFVRCIHVFSIRLTFRTKARAADLQSDSYRSKVVIMLSAWLGSYFLLYHRSLVTSLPLTRCGGFPVLFSVAGSYLPLAVFLSVCCFWYSLHFDLPFRHPQFSFVAIVFSSVATSRSSVFCLIFF